MKVLVIGPSGSVRKCNHPGGQLTANKQFLRFLQDSKIKVVCVDTYISQFPRPSVLYRFLLSIKFISVSFYQILALRPDGVYVFSGGGLGLIEKLIIAGFGRLFLCKVCLLIRDGFFLNMLNHTTPKVRFLWSVLLKIPSSIVAQGANWSHTYEKMSLGNKVVVIHNWYYNSNRLNRSIKKNSNKFINFLFVGWLVESKGVKDLIEIAKKLKDTHDSARIIFVGSGTLMQYCLHEKAAYELDNIELVGWRKQDRLSYYYNMSDAFVLPSYAEGFPNVVLEAMSYELPIISTRVGAIPDSVINDYNGYCIEPKNVDQLYDATVKLIENPELRKVFGENSLKVLKKNHDPDVCFSKLMALLNKKGKDICAE